MPQDYAIKPSDDVTAIGKTATLEREDEETGTMLAVVPSLTKTPGIYVAIGNRMSGGADITIPSGEVDDFVASILKARDVSAELWNTQPLTTVGISSRVSNVRQLRQKADELQAEVDALQVDLDRAQREGTIEQPVGNEGAEGAVASFG
jgi:hypothetical protein